MRSKAATNGEAPACSSFHGMIVTSRNAEPTKKTAIRTITELAALAIFGKAFRMCFSA